MLQLTSASCVAKVVLGAEKISWRLFATFFGAAFFLPGGWTCCAALLGSLPSPAFAEQSLSEIPARQIFHVFKQRDGNVIRFFVQNLEATDVTATFELALVNLKGNTCFPYTTTFPPHQITEAFSLSPIREDTEWRYMLTNYYTLGSNHALHDAASVYSLPYAAGQAFCVSQGYDGAFSHSGPERYAIDWRMPKGTTVLAARAGMVVASKDDSSAGGADKKFESSANYILIQHQDGTIGNYAHLLTHGVRVKVGQAVETGDVIGLSGNTGFSSGPHLHFSVFKAKDGKSRESIPISFRTDKGTATPLLAGQAYRAPETLLVTTKSRTRRVLN